MFLLARTFAKTPHISSPQRIFISTIIEMEKFGDINFKNEPLLEYLPNSPERASLMDALECIKSQCEEIPIVINGKEVQSDCVRYQFMPHKHSDKICKFYHATKKQILKACSRATDAQVKWDSTTLAYRIKVWERAANNLATKHRSEIVAATMLGQGRTVRQAEDCIAHLIDHIRLNAQFLKQQANFQPFEVNPEQIKNQMRLRGLEGFVAAISPFNSTSIATNLAYTPALMGNAVVWKPADESMLACWRTFNIMREAGVPDGVMNFVPAFGPTFGENITYSTHLAGINFTGSELVFKTLWKLVGHYLDYYKNFPRLVGECGGKNFHFVHETADVDVVVANTIRSAFEFGGQKCAACSRLYVPETMWESKIKQPLLAETKKLIVDDVCNFDTFYSALINEKAFQRVTKYIEYAKRYPGCKIITGGFASNLKGYFIEPTIIESKDPKNKLFRDEIYGPVLVVYVYKTDKLEETMDLIAETPKFALTGSVFAQDEKFQKVAVDKFKLATGNFYINDKSNAYIVGQQPFGGGRMSGTNDKSGGPHYILRWTSPQTITQQLKPTKDIYYPYMDVC